MSKNPNNMAVISDFDGTISHIDFFHFVVENLLQPGDLKPWEAFLDNKITHVDALRGIFGRIRLEKDVFNSFILDIPVDNKFVDTVNFCEVNDIPFYVVSAGADYYIKLLLKHYEVYEKVTLITNKSKYSVNKGIYIPPGDVNWEYYCPEYGIDKLKVVTKLKKANYKIVFVGDGSFDLPAAKYSSVIFAKDKLLKRCKEQYINCFELTGFEVLLSYLRMNTLDKN